MTLTLPKWGLGSPLKLLKTQNSIAGVKTPCLDVFFIPLERSWSVDVGKMALHEPFGHLQHKLGAKEGLGVKLTIWLQTTKSRESTRPRCVQAEWDTPLESSQGKLQVCFRPHPDQRSEQGIMSCQSPGNPNRDSFGTISGLPLGSPGTKSHLDVAPMEWRRVYYVGEGGGFPRVRAVVNEVNPELPLACPSTKGAPKCVLTNLLVGLMHVRVSE
jgi:hypothetical protein